METSHLGGYHWVPLKGGNRCEASEVYNMLCILAEAQHLLRCRSVVLHHQKGKVLTITQGLAVQVAWNSSTRHNNASFLTGWRAKGISSDSSGISFHYTLGECRIWLQTNEGKLRGKRRRNIATRRVPTAIQSPPKIGDPLRGAIMLAWNEDEQIYHDIAGIGRCQEPHQITDLCRNCSYTLWTAYFQFFAHCLNLLHIERKGIRKMSKECLMSRRTPRS